MTNRSVLAVRNHEDKTAQLKLKGKNTSRAAYSWPP